MTELEVFATFVDALGADRKHVLVIGGWAFRLLGLHPLAAPQPSMIVTNDVDVLVSSAPGSALGDRLHSAGFQPRFKTGDERPPVTDYVHAKNIGAPIEFLVAERRGRRTSPPTQSIGGVNAQTLRGLDLLLVAPWQVQLSAGDGFPLQAVVDIQIPNPIAFALHKLIVSKQRRDRRKREKDLLYAFDTLVLFSARERELGECQAAVTKSLTRAMLKSLQELGRALSVPTDAVRGAARIATASGRPSPPLPEQIAATLAAGLRRYGI